MGRALSCALRTSLFGKFSRSLVDKKGKKVIMIQMVMLLTYSMSNR